MMAVETFRNAAACRTERTSSGRVWGLAANLAAKSLVTASNGWDAGARSAVTDVTFLTGCDGSGSGVTLLNQVWDQEAAGSNPAAPMFSPSSFPIVYAPGFLGSQRCSSHLVATG